MKRLLVALALVTAPTMSFVARTAHAGAEDDLVDGDKYFEEGDWKKAATAYDRAIAKVAEPGLCRGVRQARRDLHHSKGFERRARVRRAREDAVSERARDPRAGSADAVGQRRARCAIDLAERVVKARPTSFANQKIIGEYYAQRDPVKTAAAYEGYLAHRPAELEGGDVLPRIQLGFAYLSNARAVLGDGDEQHAEQLYNKAVEQFDFVARKLGKKPNAQINANNGLCAAYTGLRKWDQAVTVCERIVTNPKSVDTTGSVWFNLATAYLANRQSKKARAAATSSRKCARAKRAASCSSATRSTPMAISRTRSTSTRAPRSC